MKNDVDKRVVEFEFDNSKFDKNVKKSTKTLNKFDETLQFKDVSKSLDEIKIKFSALDVVFASVTRNITDRVVNLGIRLIKSLSVDNLSAGWTKFGEKTIAVGTLMSQSLKIAGREIEDYSEKMGIVNDQLDKLNWFTDETSYNFTDMVDNIGKFTAAGQDLDKSVEAMMGIANWAALSGQNAATASRAMYQLSQALGKGYVQLIDYKSIQNANMDTQEFRKTVLETAVAMGELTKEGENYIAKTGKKFTQNQFAEQLNSKWFTSDVLTASLKKYSGAVDKLYEITEKEGITASEAIELYGDQFDELAIKAFKAAQEARTFSDAINSVKDAVSTGWMTTAEMIFGSYDEAKEFWTQLANELYDVFAESGNIRNEILSIWKALEGRSDLFTRGGPNQGAFWNLYDSIIAVRDAISDAWNTIFPKSEFEDEDDRINDIAHNLKTLTSNFQKATARVKDFFEQNEDLKQILGGVFSIVKMFVATIEALRYALDPIVYTLKELALTVSSIFADLGSKLSSSTGYAEGLFSVAAKINEVLTHIFSVIDLPNALRKVASLLGTIFSAVKRIFSVISDFLKSHVNLSDMLSSITSGLSSLTDKIKEFFSQIGRKSGNNATNIVTTVIGVENNTVLKSSATNASETVGILQILKDFAMSILNLLKSLYPVVTSVIVLATSLINAFASAFRWLSSKIIEIANWQSETNKSLKYLLMVAAGAFIIFKIIDIFLNIKWLLEYMKGNIFSTLDDAADALRRWGLSKIIKSIGYDLLALASSFLIIVAGAKLLSTVGWSEIEKALVILSALVGFAVLLVQTSKKLSNSFSILEKEKSFFSRNGESTTLREIGSVMLSLGVTFWIISKSLTNFKEISETENAFRNAIKILGLLSATFIVLQLISKKTDKASVSMRRMLPSMFQFIGFAVSLKILAKTVVNLSAMIEKLTEIAKKNLMNISLGISGIVAALIVINNWTRKAGYATGNLRTVTISFGLKLGVTLMGIASLLLSASLFMKTIRNLGDEATKVLIWTASIIGGIMLLCIAIEAITNSGLKKLASLGNIGKIKRDNPVASLLSSIAFLLLSISASIAILSVIKITSELKQIMIGVGIFIGAILVIAGLMQMIPNKSVLGKGEISGIAALIKAISTLLLAMAAVMVIAVIIPDKNEVKKIGIALMVFVLGILALAAVIVKGTKAKSAIKAVASIVAFAGALVVLALAMRKFQTTVKVDWKIFGYLSAIIGVILLVGAAVGGFPIIAGGLVLLALSLILMGVALRVLAWGIKNIGDGLVPFSEGLSALGDALSKFNLESVAVFTGLLVDLAGIEIVGILEAIFGGARTIGASLKDLAYGLSQLVEPLNELTVEGAKALGSLFAGLAAVEVAGILEKFFGGYSGIAQGMSSLAVGIETLKDPIKDLDLESIKCLGSLLSTLSSTWLTGLLAGFGHMAIGEGLSDIADGITAIVPALNIFEKEHLDKLHYVIKFLNDMLGLINGWTALGQGIANWIGASKGDYLKNALYDISAGLDPFITQMNRLYASDRALESFSKIIGVCFDIDSQNFNTEKLSEMIRVLSELKVPENIEKYGTSLQNIAVGIKRILELDFSEDDFTIRPIIDLTDFEIGYNKLSSMLSSLKGDKTNLSSELAYKVASSQSQNGNSSSIVNNTTNSSNDTYSITMNITTNDPYELAEEFDRILQQTKHNSKLAVGK